MPIYCGCNFQRTIVQGVTIHHEALFDLIRKDYERSLNRYVILLASVLRSYCHPYLGFCSCSCRMQWSLDSQSGRQALEKVGLNIDEIRDRCRFDWIDHVSAATSLDEYLAPDCVQIKRRCLSQSWFQLQGETSWRLVGRLQTVDLSMRLLAQGKEGRLGKIYFECWSFHYLTSAYVLLLSSLIRVFLVTLRISLIKFNISASSRYN